MFSHTASIVTCRVVLSVVDSYYGHRVFGSSLALKPSSLAFIMPPVVLGKPGTTAHILEAASQDTWKLESSIAHSLSRAFTYDQGIAG